MPGNDQSESARKKVIDEKKRRDREIGGRLQQARYFLKLTLEQVSREAAVEKSHLSEWERGEKTIPLSSLMNLAESYGMSLDYLVGMSDEMDEARTNAVFINMARKISADSLNVQIAVMAEMVAKNINIIEHTRCLVKAAEEMAAVSHDLQTNEAFEDLRCGAKFVNRLSAMEGILHKLAGLLEKQWHSEQYHVRGYDEIKRILHTVNILAKQHTDNIGKNDE